MPAIEPLVVDAPRCLLEECDNILSGKQTKYCSDDHQRKAQKRRATARKKIARTAAAISVAKERERTLAGKDRSWLRKSSEYLAKAERLGLIEGIIGKTWPDAVIADRLDCSVSEVTRIRISAVHLQVKKELQAEWDQPATARELLGDPLPDAYDSWVEHGDEWLDEWLDRHVELFCEWRDTYFDAKIGRRRGQYINTPFHRKWIRAILRCLVLGEHQMILSPPRHGKTDLLIHFCIWLILKDPEFTILWVGNNEDLAKISVNKCRLELEANDRLIRDYCPPGVEFRPPSRSAEPWSSLHFTVSTRGSIDKSPTMAAVGMNGTINSRDVSFLVCDDVQDFKQLGSPTTRETQRTWFTQTLDARDEEHTAWFVIGSRQHADDLYFHLLNSPSWMESAIVESAHDPDCILPVDQPDLHIGCMLFPEVRSFSWLQSKFEDAAEMGGVEVVEMVYLNVQVAQGTQVFTAEIINQCYDPSRLIGDLKALPPSIELVAGLDPASTGHQAAFLWGFDYASRTIYMIDCENRLGGGTGAAVETFQKWYDLYGLKLWYVEVNNFQKMYRSDMKVMEWARHNGALILPHETNRNKWDPVSGLGSTGMISLFTNRNVVLPSGNATSLAKVNLYRRQLLNLPSEAPKGRRVTGKTDVAMASWFPIPRWFQRITEIQPEADVDYDQEFAGFTTNDWDVAPW